MGEQPGRSTTPAVLKKVHDNLVRWWADTEPTGRVDQLGLEVERRRRNEQRLSAELQAVQHDHDRLQTELNRASAELRDTGIWHSEHRKRELHERVAMLRQKWHAAHGRAEALEAELRREHDLREKAEEELRRLRPSFDERRADSEPGRGGAREVAGTLSGLSCLIVLDLLVDARHLDGWSRLDLASVPVAACVALAPALVRRRWSFAVTVAVPVVLLAAISLFALSGAPLLSGHGEAGLLAGGCTVSVLLALAAARRRGAGRGAARRAVTALGGFAILVVIAVQFAITVAGREWSDFGWTSPPFVIGFGCIVIQSGWESDPSNRRFAGLATVAYALVETVVFAAPGSQVMSVALVRISLLALLVAGLLAAFLPTPQESP